MPRGQNNLEELDNVQTHTQEQWNLNMHGDIQRSSLPTQTAEWQIRTNSPIQYTSSPPCVSCEMTVWGLNPSTGFPVWQQLSTLYTCYFPLLKICLGINPFLRSPKVTDTKAKTNKCNPIKLNKLLHNKGNYKWNEKTTHRTGESMMMWPTWA